MPCRCDDIPPSKEQIELKKVIAHIYEITNQVLTVEYGSLKSQLDQCTRILCQLCQVKDVTQYSLELQIWWRDHQIADKKRLERELEEQKLAEEKAAALAKLTDYEKSLLDL